MEKYREINWNNELEIERERNKAKSQKEMATRYEPYYYHDYERRDKPSEMSAFKMVLIIALGILTASFIGCTASMFFTGAIITGVGEAIAQKQKETPSPTTSYTPRQLILPELRSEIIRKRSEEALLIAKQENQSFKSQYKKPDECLIMNDRATRISCANAYMRARTTFNNNQDR